MEPEHPNEAGGAGGPSGARGPDTDEWLVAGLGEPAPGPPMAREGSTAPAPVRRLSAGAVERRLGAIEAAVKETSRRAIAAEERAEDALGRLRALRVELDALRAELSSREEIAREEALALQRAVTDSGVADAQATPPPALPDPVASGQLPPFEEDLLGFNRVAGVVEERMHEIEHRVAAADEAVRSLAPKPDSLGNGAARPSRPLSEPVPAPDPGLERDFEAEPDSHSSPIDVNRIGFEQLREIGLSVTQAARLLARRDARGEYSSLDQLDDLLDFPRELIDRLKRSLRIG